MAYQVKKSYLRIITILLGFISYSIYLFSNIEINTFDLKQFGMYLFLIVPILMVFEIVGTIIFDLFNQTDSKKERPKHMDEFDRLIEYKAVRNFMIVFVAGFFTSTLILWLSANLIVAFIVMFVMIFLSGLMLQVSYIKYYNHGVS
ncbi:MAG: hypothetical protein AB7E61_00420 [Acholeplasmataceae bacterium]